MTDTRTDYTARAPKTSLPGFSESVHFSGWPLRVGVISNPLSGRNRKGMAPIAKVLREQPHVSQCEAQTPGEVASALADFARKGVALVVINGGDGTIQSVLTVLFNRKPFEAQPVLALLRSGTASMIARDVGLSGSPAQALRRLLAWANGSTRDAVILQRHTLRMQLGADEEPRFGMFFGTGAITKSIRFCHEKIESLGLRGELGPGLTLAWFILAHTIRGTSYLPPLPITVGLDRHALESHRIVTLLVSTLERLFLGLRPYWGTGAGPVHYSALSGDARHLLRVLPSLLRGRPHHCATPQNGFFSHNVREVRLELRTDFMLDGELFVPKNGAHSIELCDGGKVSFLKC